MLSVIKLYDLTLQLDFYILIREGIRFMQNVTDWIETWYTFLVPKNEGQVR